MKYFIKEKAQFLGLFHIRSFFKKGKLCNFVEKNCKANAIDYYGRFSVFSFYCNINKPSPKKKPVTNCFAAHYLREYVVQMPVCSGSGHFENCIKVGRKECCTIFQTVAIFSSPTSLEFEFYI